MATSPTDAAQNRDREFFHRELDTFVPPRVFDAHAHLYRAAFLAGDPPPMIKQSPEFGMAAFKAAIEELTPGRRTSGLFFGFPHAAIDTGASNRFLAEEIQSDPQSRGQMLVTPAMDPEFVRENVRRYRFVGLKCYHVFATTRPTFDAAIPDYLPEGHVRIAHEEGLSITLHMVRARAMADPVNQEVIRDFASRYPNARFILAHAARGFNPFHTIEGIGALKGLRNVWCDTSAVTDGGAYEAIVRTLGVDRLMYGSDAPVSHLRGRCVAIGDSFLWLNESNTRFAADYAQLHPALVGHESLRTLKMACWNLGLSDSEVEKIFFGNAAELYGIEN